ncbi:MAG: NUDIX domain-containing protein [Actinomycetia bacterium]|nr:NUDIX domain-containing protein [Actinomycetes bacterium]MCP4961851.1 NUDIX domain-containing protein [Actinomycetes bacterium]
MTKPATSQDLAIWGESLGAIARTGLGFTDNLYERERFEEVLKIAAEIRSAAIGDPDPDGLVVEWMKSVGSGVSGYVTPKVTVGAIVGNEQGEILLVQRADSGVWLFPTGWADVGYSPSEVAVKEVFEETGIQCEVVRVLTVLDGMRRGFTKIPLVSIVFLCRAVGGEIDPHPLETSGCGWFPRDGLPEPTAGAERWADEAFSAIGGNVFETSFDAPRRAPWDE